MKGRPASGGQQHAGTVPGRAGNVRACLSMGNGYCRLQKMCPVIWNPRERNQRYEISSAAKSFGAVADYANRRGRILPCGRHSSRIQPGKRFFSTDHTRSAFSIHLRPFLGSPLF